METEIKFPNYCCFGKLQEGSVIETDDEIAAIYQMFGMKVHELKYFKKKNCWSLQEFSPEGNKTMYSFNSSLDKTICFHMNYLDDIKNPLLQCLRKELLKLGTVWFAPFPSMQKGEISASYSPAGKLLAVRLLLVAGDDLKPRIEKLQGLFEYYNPQTNLKLKMQGFYETICIFRRYDGSGYQRMAFVAEYIVPLAFVYDTVKLFHDSGMLIRNSVDRVFVQDITTLRESNEYDFFLTDVPGTITFSVILKGLLISHDNFTIQLKNFEKKNQVKSLN